MKILQWVLGIIASLMCILALLLTSFEVAMYSDYGWYEKEYKKYAVTEDLTMEISDVMDVTHEMMSYLRGDREDLVVYTTIDNMKHQEFFNKQDKLHMADVRSLFVGGLKLRWIAIAIMMLCIIVMFLIKTECKKILPKAYQIGLGISATITALVGIYFTSDFNAAFTKFHEIFFTNDLWIFDPSTDYMIRMLPEEFFADMVARIGILFIAGLVLLLIISIIFDRYTKMTHKSSSS